MNSKKFARKSIPKPLNKKYSNKINISDRKLIFSRNENYLLNKYSNSQKSTSRTDINKINITNNEASYPSSKIIINNDFPKRKLNRAKTFQEQFENYQKKEQISKIKQKKIKNLELFIKLIDENEKIENEFYSNADNIDNYTTKINFKRNKSDVGLYKPCITYNKKNIYYHKKYSLIQKKIERIKNNSYKYISTNPFIKENFNEKKRKEKNGTKSPLLINKMFNDKNNSTTRRKKKSNTMNLNIIFPYNNSHNNQIISKKIINNYNLLDKNINNTFSKKVFNTELNINNISKFKLINMKKNDKNSNSVKSIYGLSKSKSKEKISNKKIFPLVNSILEESSKIEKNLKYDFKKIDNNKEKDIKKEINEVKKLTKRKKINIDKLRKRLNLNNNYLENTKKNYYFDINDIMAKNINKMKKIVPKNGINIITEAANKIIYEDKILHKDIIYYNKKFLKNFKENKKDKIYNNIYEKQNQIKKEIIGKTINKNENFINLLKEDFME